MTVAVGGRQRPLRRSYCPQSPKEVAKCSRDNNTLKASFGNRRGLFRRSSRWVLATTCAVEIYYHSNTYNASVTTYPGPAFPVAVKFDVPGSSATYQLTRFGISHRLRRQPVPREHQDCGPRLGFQRGSRLHVL